jgi:hypothetical protein
MESGGGGQDRTADLGVMKTLKTNTISYLHALQGRRIMNLAWILPDPFSDLGLMTL